MAKVLLVHAPQSLLDICCVTNVHSQLWPKSCCWEPYCLKGITAPPRAGHNWAEDERFRTPEALWFGILRTKDLISRTLFTQEKHAQIKGETPNPHAGVCPLVLIPLSNLVIKTNSNCFSATLAACFYCNQCISLGSVCLPCSFLIYSKNLIHPGFGVLGIFQGVSNGRDWGICSGYREKKFLEWSLSCLIHPLIFSKDLLFTLKVLNVCLFNFLLSPSQTAIFNVSNFK